MESTLMVEKTAGSEEEIIISEVEALCEEAHSILNNYKSQSLDTIVSKMKSLQIDTEEKLQGVVNIFYEKACDDSNFPASRLLTYKDLSLIKVIKLSETDSKEHIFVDFRNSFIIRCLDEFKNSLEDIKEYDGSTDSEQDLQTDKFEEEINFQIKSANVRLIGELYMMKLANNEFMKYCVLSLLVRHKDEANLEQLCVLLRIVEAKLEFEVSLVEHFKLIEIILVEKDRFEISVRIRSELEEIIKLRKKRLFEYKEVKTTGVSYSKAVGKRIHELYIHSDRKWGRFINCTLKRVEGDDDPISPLAGAIMCKIVMAQISVRPPKYSSVEKFEEIINSKCQEELEYSAKNSENIDQKSLRKISFIAELFNLELFKNETLHSCISILLEGKSNGHIQILCKILMIVGRNLEAGKELKNYFEVIQQMVNDKDSGCSLLQELIDLRANLWRSKRGEFPTWEKEISTFNALKRIILWRFNVREITSKMRSSKKEVMETEFHNDFSTENLFPLVSEVLNIVSISKRVSKTLHNV